MTYSNFEDRKMSSNYRVIAVVLNGSRQEYFKIQSDSKITTVNRETLLKIYKQGYKINGLRVQQNNKITVDANIPRVRMTNRKEAKQEHLKQLNNQKSEQERTAELRQAIINKYRSDKTVMYHGQVQGISGEISPDKQKNTCDFGSGFYLGETLESSENRVCRYVDGRMYVFKCNFSDCNTYEFTDDVLWAIYIGYNRYSLELKEYPKVLRKVQQISKQDVIIGYIADDKISNVYSDFIAGNISDKTLIEALKLVKYGKQAALKTSKACKSIIKIAEYNMTKDIRKNSEEHGRKLKTNMESSIQSIKMRNFGVGRSFWQCLNDLEDQL